MTDEKPSDAGWLHHRLAAALGSCVVMCGMLLLVPLVFAIGGHGPEPLALYAFVFSKWGATIALGASALGFIVGGERMVNFFALIWGTHPVWSEIAGWLEEHRTAGVFVASGAVALVVGFFWYSFR